MDVVRTIATCAAALACSVAAVAAVADGGYVPPVISVSDTESYAEMTDQRALLWLKSHETELWLQNRFRSNLESFGWVIPIPHVPTVSCVDEPLLDALDHETAPLFQEIDYGCASYGTGGCGGMPGCGFFAGAGGDDSGGLSSGPTATDVPVEGQGAVEIWSSASAGCLDYSVVSSPDGQALVDWLDERGFAFDDELAAVFAGYASRGFVFLVAEIQPEQAGTEEENQTVRIAWPRLGGDDAIYPMILTGATAPSPLNMRLFVAADRPVIPANYASTFVPSTPDHPRDLEWYEFALEWALSQNGGRTFAIEYIGELFPRFGDCAYSEEYYYEGGLPELDQPETCADAEQLEQPDWLSEIWGWGSWDEEVSGSEAWNELVSASPTITRLTASLAPHQMDEDILFHETLHHDVIPMFRTEISCGEIIGQSTWVAAVDPGRTAPGLGLFAAGLLVAVAVLRRRLRVASAAVAVVLAVACGGESSPPDDPPPGLDPATLGTELCNGVDDDQDGMTDENWPGLGLPCTQGVGACAIEGVWACSLGEKGVFCKGPAGQAGAEHCNGIDDDCNGVCDDGWACCAGASFPCANACDHVGYSHCDDLCALGQCEAEPPSQPAPVGFGEVEDAYHGAMPLERDGQAPPELVVLAPDPGDDVMRVLFLDHESGIDEIELSADPNGWWALAEDFDGDGDDELIANRPMGDSPLDRVTSVFDVSVDPPVELVRFGWLATHVGGEQYVSASMLMYWIGLADYGVDDERLLLTQGRDDELLYIWPVVDGVVGEPPEPVDCATEAGRSYIGDVDGDGEDEIALPCAAAVCVIEATDLLAPDPETWSCLESELPFGFGDFDGDGLDEILTAPASTPWETETLTALSWPDLTEVGTIPLQPEMLEQDGLAIDDLDGDGRDEIALLIEWNDEIAVLVDPAFAGDDSAIGPVHALAIAPTTSDNAGLHTLEWNGTPGRDLVYDLGIALSPAGCALEEPEE